MTKFVEDYPTRVINKFKDYLDSNNITQSEAAEILGISKGQLCHILKGERTLNDTLLWRMRDMTEGKRPNNKGGIYGIYYNNEIIYIGQTVNFKRRWSGHKSSIKINKNDGQPFHNSQLDINHLSFKILFDKTKIPLFPSEVNKLEVFFIYSILPQWNTNIQSVSRYNNDLNEKLEDLINCHNKRYDYLYNILKFFLDIGLTEEGNKVLEKTLSYSKKEIFEKAIAIIKNSKQYQDNPKELTLTYEIFSGKEAIKKINKIIIIRRK